MAIAFRVRNFKAFRDTNWIPIRPLNLYFGPNGSGKSSLVEALLLTHEFLRTLDTDIHQTLLGGDLLDLGGKKSYTHKNPTGQLARFLTSEDPFDDDIEPENEFSKWLKKGLNTNQTLKNPPTSDVVLEFLLKLEPKNKKWLKDFSHIVFRICLKDKPVLSFGLCSDFSESFNTDPSDYIWHFEGSAKSFHSISSDFHIYDIPDENDHSFERIHELTWGNDPLIIDRPRKPVFSDKFDKDLLLNSKLISKLQALFPFTKDQFIENTPAEINFPDPSGWVTTLATSNSKPINLPPAVTSVFGLDLIIKYKKGITRILSNGASLHNIFGSIFYLSTVGLQGIKNAPTATQFEYQKPSEGIIESIKTLLSPDNDIDISPIIKFADELSLRTLFLLNHVTREFHDWINSLAFLGPSRIYPNRLQDLKREDTLVGADGSQAWLKLKNSNTLDEVNDWMENKLGLGIQIKNRKLVSMLELESNINNLGKIDFEDFLTVAFNENNELIDYNVAKAKLIKLINKYISKESQIIKENDFCLYHPETRSEYTLRDLGYGISQAIPILSSCASLRSKVLVVEQPELHLHPGQQADLADIFIESLLRHNNTFFIETHSEHFILRILKRIRESTMGIYGRWPKGISPSDLLVAYIDKYDKDPNEIFRNPKKLRRRSRISIIPVDNNGEFEREWPNGFFEDRLKELLSEDDLERWFQRSTPQ